MKTTKHTEINWDVIGPDMGEVQQNAKHGNGAATIARTRSAGQDRVAY